MAVRRQRSAGFTLVEMMIALVAGAFAVSAVYYLNGVSSRAFSEQMRVSETQMSLRSAMELLRRDFSRAGYLAAPNTNLAPNCDGTLGGLGVSDRLVQAVGITYQGSNTGDVVALLGAPATNRTRADLVDTWGNYATADAYLLDPQLLAMGGTGVNQIRFQEDSETFRRSFYSPLAANGEATFDRDSFLAVFAPGRMLRVEQNGRFFFRDIASRTANLVAPHNPTVVLTNVLPPCFEPSAWAAAAPIVHYRYGLEADTQADLMRLRAPTPTAPATALPGSRRTMLVRREVRDALSTTPVALTSQLLLDYAVEFSVDAWINTQAATALPVWAASTNTAVSTQSTTAPQQFRSLVLTLTARSPEADPRLPAMDRTVFNTANTFNSPLMMFRVLDPALAASVVLNARVRTLRSEIFLQNVEVQ